MTTLLTALADTTATSATQTGGDPRSIEVDGRRITYDALRALTNAAVPELAGLHTVAVLAAPTLETVLAVVTAVRAGVTVVPVSPDSTAAEIDYVLRDSGAQAWLDRAPADATIPVLTLEPTGAPSDEHGEIDCGRAAFVIYTSGTTGSPKGVELSRRSVAAGIDAVADVWGWSAQDTLVHGLPLFHVHGLVIGVLGALRVGSSLVHTGKPLPARYAAAQGSLYFGVPTVWSRVVEDEASARALSSARLLVSGSAPLPRSVFERLHDLTGHEPVERYGMTETLLTLSTRPGAARRPGWVGWPVPGVEACVVDEAGAPVATDGASVGALQVRGATLFTGYRGRPDETGAAWTPDGWFRTGDLACVDADGCHRIVGRESVDLIKTGGYRVGAGEVEDALLSHPDVAEVAVVGLADDDLGQRVAAFVVPRRGASTLTSGDDLIAHAARSLTRHKLPREVRFVDVLPRNAMGKVLKTQLVA